MNKEKLKEQKIINALTELNYKKYSSRWIRNTLISVDKILPSYLKALVSYSYPQEDGYLLSWTLGVYTDDDLVYYLFGFDRGKKVFFPLPLVYELIKSKKLVFNIEFRWFHNQLFQFWKEEDFQEMISFFEEENQKLQFRYKEHKHIIEDCYLYEEKVQKFKNIANPNTDKTTTSSLYTVAIYKLSGDIENAIKDLKEVMVVRKKIAYDYEYKRLVAYLDYLEHNTPLPTIKAPYDKTTIFECTGNDIYIAINKKAIKDENILEYFGGIKRFEKPQKISYEDMVNETGISICKAGKWTVLRLGLDVFTHFEQKDIENILLTISEKYSRSILLVNQDTSGTFGYEVYKKGEFLRRWMAGDGEVMENLGKPIIGEKKRFNDTLKNEQDAESVVTFLDSVLKITYGDLEKSKTVLYEIK